MALCWYCGANLPEKAKYCGQCGKEQERYPFVSPLPFSDTSTKLHNESQQTFNNEYGTSGKVHETGDILYKEALKQSRIFQSQRGNNRTIPDKAYIYMRKTLVELFTFYKRHKLLERNDVFERFKRLYRDVPELWDNTGAENKQLIALTRPLLDKATSYHAEVRNTPQPPLLQPAKQSADKKTPFSVEVAQPNQPLSHQNSQILLSLLVSQREFGKARSISISVRGLQDNQRALVSRENKRLDSLEQGKSQVVDIPVALNSVADQEWLECRVDLVYLWNGERCSTSHRLKIHLDSLPNSHQENHRSETRKRVGLFVDYENASLSGRQGGEQKAGEALISYARWFGEVVCCWAAADPRNIKGWADVKTRLKQAGFKVRLPRDEPSVGKAPENAADLALINQIDSETDLDIYIIMSGDGHFYETIRSLIDKGKTVRLCTSLRHLRISEKYYKLERERRSQSDFCIDDLDTVLQAPENKVSGARVQ